MKESFTKFDLGRTVATPGALALMAEHGVQPADLLLRHALNDWGDLCQSDVRANEDALKTGARILSSYKVADDEKLWVITTAADDDGRRESTCILLPSEY